MVMFLIFNEELCSSILANLKIMAALFLILTIKLSPDKTLIKLLLLVLSRIATRAFNNLRLRVNQRHFISFMTLCLLLLSHKRLILSSYLVAEFLSFSIFSL